MTYRYLAAAVSWAEDEQPALARIAAPDLAAAGRHVDAEANGGTAEPPEQPPPSVAEVRAWARANGLMVPDRGRLRPEIHQRWRDAHPIANGEG